MEDILKKLQTALDSGEKSGIFYSQLAQLEIIDKCNDEKDMTAYISKEVRSEKNDIII